MPIEKDNRINLFGKRDDHESNHYPDILNYRCHTSLVYYCVSGERKGATSPHCDLCIYTLFPSTNGEGQTTRTEAGARTTVTLLLAESVQSPRDRAAKGRGIPGVKPAPGDPGLVRGTDAVPAACGAMGTEKDVGARCYATDRECSGDLKAV